MGKFSPTSKLFISMRDNDTDYVLPAAAPICLLNLNLSVGKMPTACFLLTNENLTSHIFLLAFSLAPSCFDVVLPHVSTLVARPTPSLLLHSLFLSFMKAVMSSTKTISFSDGYTFITSLRESCNTVRRSRPLHLDPGRMAVIVWSGSATHPSN